MQEKPGLALLFCGPFPQSTGIAKYHIMKGLSKSNEQSKIGACPWLFRLSRNFLAFPISVDQNTRFFNAPAAPIFQGSEGNEMEATTCRLY
jgi:hypothetical protein